MVFRGGQSGRVIAGAAALALPFLSLAVPGAALAAFMPLNITGAATAPGATTGGQTTSEAAKGSDPTARQPNRKAKREELPDGGHFHDGRFERKRAVDDGYEARERAHHRHGHRSGDWGDGSRSGCVAQGGCSSYTGSGYRSLASGLRGSASELYSQVQNLEQQQRKVSDYSYNYNPGPSEPEAQKFRAANQSGQARVTGFSSGDPMVQDQASQYDAMGRLANELEDEAKKLQEQAGEMDKLAQKADTNADHLESRTDPGGRAGEKYGEGGTDHPNGHLQTDPSAKLARNALANQKTSKPGDLNAPDERIFSPLRPGSGITSGNTAYPTKAADTLSAVTAGAGAGTGYRGGSEGSRLRDELRARLKEQIGREPSPAEVEQAVAKATGAVTGTEGAPGAGKPGVARSAVPSDDPSAGFNKGLGNGTLEIAGSETEASVAAMMRELAVNEGAAAQSRGPASVQGSGIGMEDGPTLFERARATHRRCEERGCVNWRVAAVRGGG